MSKCVLPKAGEREGGILMWIADQWQDYELLDCGGGEKLERWDKQYLVRPDPQAIWETDHRHPAWKKANARYLRSQTGGGHWEKKTLPESWQIHYDELTFQVKPMNFKHTGLFPEQAVNWDFAMNKIRNAGRPIRVLNLFAYTGGATVACAMWMRQRVWWHGPRTMRVFPACQTHRFVGS